MSEHVFRILQVVIGFAGLILVGLYVNVTRQLHEAAKKQLENLKEQTRELSDGADTAKAQLESQTRPWIGIESLRRKTEDDDSRWIVAFRNYGGGPARNVTLTVDMQVFDASSPMKPRRLKLCKTPSIAIMPGQIRDAVLPIPERELDRLSAESTKPAPSLDIHVVYAGSMGSDEVHAEGQWLREERLWEISEGQLLTTVPRARPTAAGAEAMSVVKNESPPSWTGF